MNDLDKLKKVISLITAAGEETNVNNPVVVEGIIDFTGYIVDELENQQELSFDEVSVEDFNKLSVSLFDSGLVISITSAELDQDSISLEFTMVDTEDEAEEETCIYVTINVNTITDNVTVSAEVDSNPDAKELQTLASILYLLGIQPEDADLVIPETEEHYEQCALVTKERLMYLIGEGLIQFGTRYRKMINPDSLQVDDGSKEVSMPEFPGESSVILFGLFCINEASRLNEAVSSYNDDDEDEDSNEDSQVHFTYLDNQVDERPVEERLAEALKEASNNKTLH